MKKKPIHIAIIGGGPAGVSLCLQLTQALQNKPTANKIIIALFEKSNVLGAGLPFGLVHDHSFCINLPKQYMVLRPNQYNHFANWLAPYEEHNSQFPPRYYFGLYAAEQLEAITKEACYELRVYPEHEIKDIKALDSGGYQLQAQNHHQTLHFITLSVILASGHLPNPNFAHLQQQGAQITPWDLPCYQKIPTQAEVGIIGTRLSAIDAVLKLKQQQHQGTIRLFSRSGLLSAVRSEHKPPPMHYLIPANLQKLVRAEPQALLSKLIGLLEQEIAPHLPAPHNLWLSLKILRRMNPIDRLYLEIQQAKHQQNTWQSVLSCFYQILFKLWPMLPLPSKVNFIRQHRGTLISLLCSFPLEKAYILYEMMRQGQLQIHKHLHTVDNVHPHFLLHCAKESFRCEHLILALGSGNQPEIIPLYASMLKQGLISKHALGGLNINLKTYQALDAQNQSTNLYALGDLVKGACFNMIEIGQVVQQASVIAEHLVQQMTSQPTFQKNNKCSCSSSTFDA